MSDTTKVCKTCQEVKALDEFYVRSDTGSHRSECKVCVGERSAHTRKTNPHKVALYSAKQRAKMSPEELTIQRARVRDWKRRNPHKVALYKARRRFTVSEPICRTLVYERDNGVCHICGAPVKFEDMHLDHIVSAPKGGTHTYDNVAIAHSNCNLSKNDKWLTPAWARY